VTDRGCRNRNGAYIVRFSFAAAAAPISWYDLIPQLALWAWHLPPLPRLDEGLNMDHMQIDSREKQLRDRKETQRSFFARAAGQGVVAGLFTALAVWTAMGATLFGGPWLMELGKTLTNGLVGGTMIGVAGAAMLVYSRVSGRTRRYRRTYGEDQPVIPEGLTLLSSIFVLAVLIIVSALIGAIVAVGFTLEVQLKRQPNQTITLLLATFATSAVVGLLIGVGSYYWQTWQPGETVGINERYK
jgi:hypothetical protein